jgi:hypothetical protein
MLEEAGSELSAVMHVESRVMIEVVVLRSGNGIKKEDRSKFLPSLLNSC